MAFEITFNCPALPELMKKLAAEPAIRIAAVNQALRNCGHILVPAIKAETPVGKHYGPKQSHGRTLRGSTAARIVVDSEVQELAITQNARTSQGVGYGIFVREGTVAHDIYPHTKKVLRFYTSTGSPVFSRHVHHPGTKANPYPQRALQSVRGQLEDEVSRINEDTAKRIAAIGAT